MFILGAVIVLAAAYVAVGVINQRQHYKAMQNLEHRIHVNGIRGKSSVTRLIAAALREGNIKTAAKTTGTAARIVVDHQNDTPVPRKEADIAEQRRMLKFYTGDLHRMYTGDDYKAVVFECMAINPIYQRYLEDKIMHSTIGVITNVREDHVELLGTTLPEIARSLSMTIPKNGHLVTAETNPELLAILKQECEVRGSKLHAVGTMRITEKQMAAFKHFEYRANVAIAVKVAELLGVTRQTALSGMHSAQPDPGAFILKKFERDTKTLHWANLFAINDRESFILTVDSLRKKVGARTKKAVILNNRHDRPERVAQFVDIAVNSVKADYIFTFGDYENQVRYELKKYPNVRVKVMHLGNGTEYKDASGEVLFEQIIGTIKQKECILFGTVNIHTRQAQSLLTVLEGSNAH
ncbi:MAG TPA: poly-gamma-glutamate synthase PgsB [Magnetospirillaceae bacterium]|nr:poly-gamma-glutamate synthase PgsB [Magnetospirillaceae bacterium]